MADNCTLELSTIIIFSICIVVIESEIVREIKHVWWEKIYTLKMSTPLGLKLPIIINFNLSLFYFVNQFEINQVKKTKKSTFNLT